MRSSEKAVPGLKRALARFHLINLRIGAILGAGVCARTGQPIAPFANPGVGMRFAIPRLGCLFAGQWHREYASMMPPAGSAYTCRVQ